MYLTTTISSLQVGSSRKQWGGVYLYVEAPIPVISTGWLEWNPRREEWEHREMVEKASLVFSKLQDALYRGMDVPKAVSCLLYRPELSWYKHGSASCYKHGPTKKRLVVDDGGNRESKFRRLV